MHTRNIYIYIPLIPSPGTLYQETAGMEQKYPPHNLRYPAMLIFIPSYKLVFHFSYSLYNHLTQLLGTQYLSKMLYHYYFSHPFPTLSPNSFPFRKVPVPSCVRCVPPRCLTTELATDFWRWNSRIPSMTPQKLQETLDNSQKSPCQFAMSIDFMAFWVIEYQVTSIQSIQIIWRSCSKKPWSLCSRTMRSL